MQVNINLGRYIFDCLSKICLFIYVYENTRIYFSIRIVCFRFRSKLETYTWENHVVYEKWNMFLLKTELTNWKYKIFHLTILFDMIYVFYAYVLSNCVSIFNRLFNSFRSNEANLNHKIYNFFSQNLKLRYKYI